MTSDMSYYREVRDTDPSYTVRHAIREYLREHKALREQLVWDYDSYYGPDPDDTPMDWDTFEEYVKGGDPWEMFELGVYVTEFNWSDDWVHFDGYGHPETWNDWGYQEWLDRYVDAYLIDAILDGDKEVAIPREMADVLALWVDEDELCVSSNFKARAKPKQKGRAPSGKARPKRKAPSRSRPAKSAPKKTMPRPATKRATATKRAAVQKRAAPTRKPTKRSREPATKTAYLTGARR